MIEENEKAPTVFTKSGEEWLTDLLKALRADDYNKSAEIGNHESWRSGCYKDGFVQKTHPNYGRIIKKDNDEQYLLIRDRSYLDDITEKIELNSHKGNLYHYKADNFGQVRIYQEACARGVDDYFVPITGWDGNRFSWMTMPVVSNYQRSDGGTSKSDSLIKSLSNEDRNWVIHDEEVGTYKGKRVLTDYDMCWYDDEWIVSESQIMNP